MSDEAPAGDAADAFAEQARAAHDESIRHLIAFGAAVRGDDRGVHTEVEILLVLEDAEPTVERELERLAETVGLEHGVVVSLHVLPADRFEENEEHPFVQTALEDGRAYV
ncbi:hypothetical protein [Natrinema sp. 74]|uniref:hypothetical protein n=1 Tax=Natrinema sp. 74 TaxID=3384159 RepID=UPI0038D36492